MYFSSKTSALLLLVVLANVPSALASEAWNSFPAANLAQTSTATPKERLPLLGLMADVGVPDGLMASLAVRPLKYLRANAGAGNNGISYGWRAGATLLPFGHGPSISLDYGRYQEGNANKLAHKFLGGDSSTVLDRIGYQYINAHLGLDFGFRRVVFFIHGGITKIWGHLHGLDSQFTSGTTTGTSEIATMQSPRIKLIGPSIKIGLIAYAW